MLTRDDILAVSDLKIERVDVPEWGGDVCVKGMSGMDRDRFEASLVERKNGRNKINLDNVRARICAYTVCDESGKLLFSEADIEALGKKSASALTRIFAVAQRLSGITESDVQEMTDNLQKNV